MRKILIVCLMMAPCLFAYGNPERTNCQEVGGAVLTDFLSPVNPQATPITTTLGTATGDFRGGTGVDVLSMTPGPNSSTIFHNHHRWVTESGETILLADADAPAFPTGIPGLFITRYTNGVAILGGTGRFAGASGNLDIWGVIDLRQDSPGPQPGRMILRYLGTVCFANPERSR